MKLSDEKQNLKDLETDNFGYWDLTKTVWGFLENQKWSFLILLIIYGLTQAAFFGTNYLLGLFASFFVKYKAGDSLDKVYWLIASYAAIFALTNFSRLRVQDAMAKICVETVSKVKKVGIQKLIEFPLDWHQKENSGNKIQKIQKGTTSLQQLLNLLRRFGVFALVNILTPIIIFIFVDTKLLLVLSVSTIFYYFVNNYFDKKIDEIDKKINKLEENQGGTLFETSSNILTTKAMSADTNITKSTFKIEDEVVLFRHQRRRLLNNKWVIFQLFYAMSLVIFLFIMLDRMLMDPSNAAFILVYANYFNRYDDSVKQLLDTLTDFQETKAGIARMMPIFNETPDIYFGKDNFPSDWGQIKLVDANFIYSQQAINEKTGIANSALENLNLTIKKGERIGIVGRSGSGKSTLAKLLIGLYKLENGDFKIGDSNYYDISHSEITKHISIVLQETELFNMSFLENLTLLKDIQIETVQRALEIAQLGSVIAKLPKGLDTKLGEKGYKLSGGEKQRVGIARAICSGAEVLILDEATSALDSQTEQLIQESLEQNLQDKTLIIIAHRLSTLKDVDRIIVFENGKILEEGKFEELLLNNESKFSELWKFQVEE